MKRWLAGGLLFSALAAGGAGYWLVATSSGLQFVMQSLVTSIPLPLTYHNLQGSILTAIKADRAQYKTSKVRVSIEQFATGFSLATLLSGRLAFDNVRALDVEVLQLSDAPEVSPQDGLPTDEPGDGGLALVFLLRDVAIKTLRIANEEKTIARFSDVVLRKAKIRDKFAFQDLAFATGAGSVTASGAVGFSASAAVELTAAWQTKATEQIPAARGAASFKGTYQQLTVDGQLDAPVAFAVRGEIDRPFSGLAWQANITGNVLPLSLFRSDIDTELHRYELNANGDLSKFSVQGQSELWDAELGKWSASLNAHISASHIELTALNLAALDSSATLAVTGTTLEHFDIASQGPFKIAASWKNLQWPLADTPTLVSKAGQLEITGSINDYQVQLADTDLIVNHQAVTQLNANGHGNSKNLSLADFSAVYLAGSWQGKGRLEWADAFLWDAAITVQGLDPSIHWPQWPASLNGAANIKGQHKAGGWQVAGEIKQLGGKLAGVAIDQASLGFEATEGRYSVKNLSFKSRQNQLRGAAEVKLAADTKPYVIANWNINAKNLAQLLPDVKGAIISQGKMRGELASLQVSTSIQAQDLVYKDYRIGAINGTVNLDPSINSALLIDLKLDGLASGKNEIQQLSLQGQGTTGNHQLALSSALDARRSLQLTARGGYANELWNGMLVATRIDTAEFGQWKQQQPSDVSVSLAQLNVGRYCLTPLDADAQVCLEIQSALLDDWKGAINIKNLPVATFRKYYPPQVISAKGAVSGSASYHFQKNVIRQFQARLISENGEVVYGLAADDPQNLTYRRLQADITHTEQGVRITSKMDLAELGDVDIRASLKDKHTLSPLDASQQIQGRIVVDLKSLTILPLIFTDIQYIEGRKYSEYSVSGTIGNPLVVGHSDITMAALTLPRLGIELKDIKISARSDEKYTIKVSGQARSGDGRIVINGEMLDYRNANLLAKMTITGENFPAARLPEITMDVSPQLTAIVKNDELRLEGELLIPKSIIQILKPVAVVAPSADVVIINGDEEPEPPAKKLKLTAEVKVKLGHNVKLEGFGVNSRLLGEVVVLETPEGTTLGTGEIRFAEGRFSAYDRELVIESGTLTYASSPIENPIVNIKATRKIDAKTRVGVIVSGYAQDPKLELFSEPAMEQSDILSYLILGYPISQASKSDGSTLSGAAGSIGLIGGEILAKQIANQFGIDDVKVISDSTTQQATLALGKYLSPRLYAQYAMGIGQAVNTFRVEYELTSRWMLKTEASSEQQGADLFYTIEFD